AEILLAAAYRYGGYLAVGLVTTAAFAAAFAWLYRQLARLTDHPPAAAAVTVLAAQASMIQLVARPVVFSLPLFVAVCLLAREPKFWGLLADVLLALVARGGRRPLTAAETAWGLGWLALALVSARMAPYGVIAWAPILAGDLSGLRFGVWNGLRDALAPVERQ